MIEVGLILFGIGVVLNIFTVLFYKQSKFNDEFVLWIGIIGWFLMMVGAFFIGRYVVDEFGWYII